ncbi:probable transcriptional regulator (plasmid) [Rhodococcus jostii RHA1]|uniref:Probable transcriptional regulator n=1 Tax=Rhodococcus jostii (strain RHA1) TaxID=101510 RepID=Q0RWG2_RHOJR|nr:probable transcriptional regulator [Rhodococcus jostii RHA1]
MGASRGHAARRLAGKPAAHQLPRHPRQQPAPVEPVRRRRGPQRHSRTADRRRPSRHRRHPSPGSGPALRDAIDRFIEQNLLDEHLNPGAIAAAHGVSVRTVNRHRPDRQRHHPHPPPRTRSRRAHGPGKPIGAIATKWGFSDGPHFTRTFKSTYGTTPKEFREAYLAKGGATMQQDVPRVHGLTDGLIETGVPPAQR